MTRMCEAKAGEHPVANSIIGSRFATLSLLQVAHQTWPGTKAPGALGPVPVRASYRCCAWSCLWIDAQLEA